MNFDVVQLIKNIRSITKALSFPRIIKLFLIFIFGIFFFSLFERRALLFTALLEPLVERRTEPFQPAFTLSDSNIDEINTILFDHPGVNAVAVLSIDLRLNTKTVVYKNFDKKLVDIGVRIPTVSPLFTENGQMNNRTVFLMGGDVYCMVSTPENLGSILQGLNLVVPYSCAIPIPPTYGDFSGWIFVGFDRVLSDIELKKFKARIIKISTNIKKGA